MVVCQTARPFDTLMVTITSTQIRKPALNCSAYSPKAFLIRAGSFEAKSGHAQRQRNCCAASELMAAIAVLPSRGSSPRRLYRLSNKGRKMHILLLSRSRMREGPFCRLNKCVTRVFSCYPSTHPPCWRSFSFSQCLHKNSRIPTRLQLGPHQRSALVDRKGSIRILQE